MPPSHHHSLFLISRSIHLSPPFPAALSLDRTLRPPDRPRSAAMSVRTVKVSNISPKATLRDMKEFFLYSGEIEYIELESGNEMSKMAYITFKELQGAETAQLFTGSMIMDQQVEITFAEHYSLPPDATAPASASASKKAEDAVSAMLARGFVLGKDVVNKAKAFDEKHKWMATASASVSSFDRKISEKVKEANEKYQVSRKTKSAYETTRERVGQAGTSLLNNRFVSTGMTWVYSAFSRVTGKAEAPAAAKENVSEQQEQKRTLELLDEEFAKLHLENPQVEMEQTKIVDGETLQTKKIEGETEQMKKVEGETEQMKKMGGEIEQMKIDGEVEQMEKVEVEVHPSGTAQLKEPPSAEIQPAQVE